MVIDHLGTSQLLIDCNTSDTTCYGTSLIIFSLLKLVGVSSCLEQGGEPSSRLCIKISTN